MQLIGAQPWPQNVCLFEYIIDDHLSGDIRSISFDSLFVLEPCCLSVPARFDLSFGRLKDRIENEGED